MFTKFKKLSVNDLLMESMLSLLPGELATAGKLKREEILADTLPGEEKAEKSLVEEECSFLSITSLSIRFGSSGSGAKRALFFLVKLSLKYIGSIVAAASCEDVLS